MYVVAVTILLNRSSDQFIDAILDNATTAAGNRHVRFDVLQARGRRHPFFAVRSPIARGRFRQHQQTEHHVGWKNKVATGLPSRAQGVKHNSIFFGDGICMARFEFFSAAWIVFGPAQFARLGGAGISAGKAAAVIHNRQRRRLSNRCSSRVVEGAGTRCSCGSFIAARRATVDDVTPPSDMARARRMT